MNSKKRLFQLSVDKRVWPGVILLGVLGVLSWIFFRTEAALGAILFFLFIHVSFFRDPCRRSAGEGVLSPADGKIVEVSVCDEPRFIGGKAIKIGVFLSVLNVHVNRMPWAGTLEWQEHQPGKFLNALDPQSSIQNECNWLGFREGGRKYVVRQISGLIARHIHWDIKKGETLARGAKIGMICYGSRTELYLPAEVFETLVRLGDNVKTAETILGIWKK